MKVRNGSGSRYRIYSNFLLLEQPPTPKQTVIKNLKQEVDSKKETNVDKVENLVDTELNK